MRRVISFILMLVIVLSMACPVLAATGSIPNKAPTLDWDNPKTGDIIMTWVIVLVISLAALIAAIVIYRKKFA